MSLVKRRLDEAILAGKLIEQGVDLTRLHVDCNHLSLVESFNVGAVPSLDTEEHRSIFTVRINQHGTHAVIGLDNEEIQIYSLDGASDGMRRDKHVSKSSQPANSHADNGTATELRDLLSVNRNSHAHARLLAVPKVGRAEGQPLTGIRFVPRNDSMALLASSSGAVYCCNIASLDQLAFPVFSDAQNALTCIDCSPDGSRFAIAGSDSKIRIIDTESGKLLQRLGSARPNDTMLSIGAHSTRVFALKFVTDVGSSAVFFSGGWDRSVKMWDSRCGDPLVRSFYGVEISGDSIDYANGQLLTGSWRIKDTLQLWDVSSERVIRSATPTTYIYTAQFFEDGAQTALVAGSGRNELAYIDLNSMAKVAEGNDAHAAEPAQVASKHSEEGELLLGVISFDKPIYTLHGSSASRRILFGGASPSLQLARVD